VSNCSSRRDCKEGDAYYTQPLIIKFIGEAISIHSVGKRRLCTVDSAVFR